ncbi:unannotated protein [freshwater metagenome]|uniref:Unannotated protein n=1 Tax=freshwater metagenome TaxID=449393 RepID=A0A6J7FUZ9_9ZZZZ
MLVVANVLDQRLPDSRSHAAVDLTFEQQWVEDAAGIVDADEATHAHIACLGVDVDHGDLRPEGERRTVWHEVDFLRKCGRCPGRGSRELGPGTALRGSACDVEGTRTAVEHDVVDVRLEQIGGETTRSIDERLGGDLHCRTTDLQRPRSAGATTARDEVGVAVDEPNVFHRDAGEVARDHRPRGGVALTVRRRSGAHRCRTIGMHFDRPELAPAHGVRDLDVGRDADAHEHVVVVCSTRRLLGAQFGVARRIERDVEGRLVCTDVVVRAGGRLVGELLGTDEAAASHLDRVDARLGGEQLDHALDCRRGLGTTRTPERADRCGVREDRLRRVLDLREVVAARCHGARHHGHQRTEVRRVAAAVLHHVQLVGEQRAVAGAAERCVLDLSAAVREGHHVLGARLDPAHRPVQVDGQPSDHDLFGVRALLSAEPAADVGHDDAHLLVGQSESRGDAGAGVVRTLRARPLGEALAVPHGRARTGLDGRDRHAGVLEACRDGDITTVEELWVGRGRDLVHDVGAGIREEQRRVGGRVFEVDHRGQGLVADQDELGRVCALRPRVGDDDRHRFAHETHTITSEERPGHRRIHEGHGGSGRR